MDNRVFRVDAQYFGKDPLAAEATIERGKWELLLATADEVQSFGAYALTNLFSYVEEGIPFLRCKNIRDGFADFTDVLYVAQTAHEILTKSQVRAGMVLLTMSGSVGNATVALPSWTYPINSNQDVAKISPKASISPFYLGAFLNSRFGRIQTERLPVGSVQQHIFLWMIERLKVARFSKALERRIAEAAEHAYGFQADALRLHAEAEAALTVALGLGDWNPPEPLTYTRRASEAFIAKRLDSDYFSPRVTQLLARLGASGRTVRDMAPPRHEKFTPAASGDFRYIEISDVRSDGTTTCESVPMREAASRATWRIHAGDVLTSTVRPIRRLSALVMPEQDGCIASSGFVVLQPREVPAEVLLTYLRLPLFCELMDLHTSASLYPAISETDLLRLPFPNLPPATCDAIVQSVRSAHTARHRARALLDRAKRAVEIAIEDSEGKALSFLKA